MRALLVLTFCLLLAGPPHAARLAEVARRAIKIFYHARHGVPAGDRGVNDLLPARN